MKNLNPTTYFAIKETGEFIDKSRALISGTSTTAPEQQNIFLLQYCMAAIENCAASITLMNANIYGAVACLSRPTLEFFLRGVWLRYCAQTNQVKSFISKEKLFTSKANKRGVLIEHSLRSLAEDIDATLPDQAFLFPLLDLVTNNVKHFHSSVHGGHSMLNRTKTGNTITSSFSEEEKLRLCYYQLVMCAFATSAITRTCGDHTRTDTLMYEFNRINDIVVDEITRLEEEKS
jgi:hypothetical protein